MIYIIHTYTLCYHLSYTQYAPLFLSSHFASATNYFKTEQNILASHLALINPVSLLNILLICHYLVVPSAVNGTWGHTHL